MALGEGLLLSGVVMNSIIKLFAHRRLVSRRGQSTFDAHMLRYLTNECAISIDMITFSIWHADEKLLVTDFDEFKDREFADWKRVRSSIEHENILVNHRLSWLFASHAFLYAAFAVVFNAWNNLNNTESAVAGSYQILLTLISTIGVFICATIQRGLWGAEKALRMLHRWWYSGQEQRENETLRPPATTSPTASELKDKHHPPIQGGPIIYRSIFSRFTSYTFAPTVFMVVWLIIILFVVLKQAFLQPVTSFFEKNGLTALSYLITLVAGIFIWEGCRHLMRQRG